MALRYRSVRAHGSEVLAHDVDPGLHVLGGRGVGIRVPSAGIPGLPRADSRVPRDRPGRWQKGGCPPLLQRTPARSSNPMP